MSRVGKQPISVPTGVSVEIGESAVRVEGQLGKLEQSYPAGLTVQMDDGKVLVGRKGDNRELRALHGLTRALIFNMVNGVSQGYSKGLDLVGYRVQQAGKNINLQVGYTHPVIMEPMAGITLEVEGTTRINVRGFDKQVVGEMAARIRKVRPPDAYKGKGVRYVGEQVRLKPGKAAGRK